MEIKEIFKMWQLLIFGPRYFIQLKNKKLIVLESGFLFMVVAICAALYGAIYHYNSWQIIPFILPLAWGIYTRIFGRVKDLDGLAGHWRTQLSLLKDPGFKKDSRTHTDNALENYLGARWEFEYKTRFEDTSLAKINIYMPLLLALAGLLTILIYT